MNCGGLPPSLPSGEVSEASMAAAAAEGGRGPEGARQQSVWCGAGLAPVGARVDTHSPAQGAGGKEGGGAKGEGGGGAGTSGGSQPARTRVLNCPSIGRGDAPRRQRRRAGWVGARAPRPCRRKVAHPRRAPLQSAALSETLRRAPPSWRLPPCSKVRPLQLALRRRQEGRKSPAARNNARGKLPSAPTGLGWLGGGWPAGRSGGRFGCTVPAPTGPAQLSAPTLCTMA